MVGPTPMETEGFINEALDQFGPLASLEFLLKRISAAQLFPISV